MHSHKNLQGYSESDYQCAWHCNLIKLKHVNTCSALFIIKCENVASINNTNTLKSVLATPTACLNGSGTASTIYRSSHAQSGCIVLLT